MGEQQSWSLEEAVRSYAHWWREAGLHTATDAQAHGWREGMGTPFWQRDAASAPQPASVAPLVPQRVAQPVSARPVSVDMPGTLPEFLAWLEADETQPEAAWPGPVILPSAQIGAKLLVLIEMPDMAALDAATLIEPSQRRFIESMLTSTGIARDEASFASLAFRRPPGGLLDEATLGRLVARMTHYLGLARPQAAIIFGDRTSRALIGAEWRPTSEGLQKINHGGGTTSAVALTSAEHLMNRPAAKARSWQALRLLPGAWN